MAWGWDSRWGWRDDGEWPEPELDSPIYDATRAAVAGDDAVDDPTTYTKDDGSIYQRARSDEFEDGD